MDITTHHQHGRRCSRSHGRRTCASCSPTIHSGRPRYRLHAGDLRIDYSKHLIDDDVVRRSARRRQRPPASSAPARRCSPARRSTSPSGGPCCTPRCARRRDAVVTVDGHDVVPDVHEVLGRMATFADRVRSGAWRGATGETIAHRRQHRHRRQRPRPGDGLPGDRGVRPARPACRFVSNVDGADIAGNLADLDPATTLFIVSSKTFTTIETITNATEARRWLTADARRRRGAQALRRGQHERRGGGRVRHRHREHVRLLGLGRRALLGRFGHRPVADDVDRPGAVSPVPRRLPHDRPPLPSRRRCATTRR